MLGKCLMMVVIVIEVQDIEEEKVRLVRLFFSKRVGISSCVAGEVSSGEKQG